MGTCGYATIGTAKFGYLMFVPMGLALLAPFLHCFFSSRGEHVNCQNHCLPFTWLVLGVGGTLFAPVVAQLLYPTATATTAGGVFAFAAAPIPNGCLAESADVDYAIDNFENL